MDDATKHPGGAPAADDTAGIESAAVRGGGAGAAAGVTGDDTDPAAPGGSWPDETAPNRQDG